jgi:hypothetical protein
MTAVSGRIGVTLGTSGVTMASASFENLSDEVMFSKSWRTRFE